MRKFKWAAIPVIATTLLLLAVAVALLSRNDPTSARVSAPESMARQEQPKTAPKTAAAPKQQAAKVTTKAQKQNRVASQSQKPVNKPAAKQAAAQGATNAQPKQASQANTLANPLGWRLGTRWNVAVEQYNPQLAEPRWVATEYQYKVVAANAKAKSFTVSMSLADQASQPETARGDLLRAGYELRDGALELAWVQPLGKGRKLSPDEAEMLLGENSLPLEVPASPFSGGTQLSVSAAGLGKVQANRVAIGQDETAAFAKGAPWWVTYAKGKDMKAKLTSFER